MTATEELRRLLDERGVEWMPSAFDPPHETFYKVNGVGFIVTEFPEIERVSLACDMRITPEQAVEATLGPEDAFTREDVEGAFVSGYSLGCLPAGSDPQWDQNEQTVDEHMAELGWVRERGECRITSAILLYDPDGYETTLSCGHVVHMPPDDFDYCPECGRKVSGDGEE